MIFHWQTQILDEAVLKCMAELYDENPDGQIAKVDDGCNSPHSYQRKTRYTSFKNLQTNDDRGAIWITGGAKIDRTMLMTDITHAMSSSDQLSAFSFRESRGDYTAASIMCSLSWRLAHVSKTLSDCIKNHAPWGSRYDQDSHSSQELKRILSEMLQQKSGPPIYLLVSALDKRHVAQELSDLIPTSALDTRSRVVWIISSCLRAESTLRDRTWVANHELGETIFDLPIFKSHMLSEPA
jgi:hypothetical protein